MKKIFLIIMFFIVAVSIVLLQIKEHLMVEKNTNIIKSYLENCQIQKAPCYSELNGLNIKISYDNNIFYLKPFNFSVQVKSNSKIKEIKVSFKMKKMDMGLNQFILRETKNDKWDGTGLLPICVTGSVDWLSELEIMTQDNKYIFLFPILVKESIGN